MKLFLSFILITLSLISQAKTGDTLYIFEQSSELKLQFIGHKDTILNHSSNPGTPLLVIDSIQNLNYYIDVPYHFSSIKNELTLNITIGITPKNKTFYNSHFDSIQTTINTKKHYNQLSDFGTIHLKLKNNRIRYYFEILKYTPTKEIDFKFGITEYNNSLKHLRYAESDCTEFKKAYSLFNNLTWSSLLRSSASIVSPKEYLTLEKTLVPCLGPKTGEDFLYFKQFVPLTHYK